MYSAFFPAGIIVLKPCMASRGVSVIWMMLGAGDIGIDGIEEIEEIDGIDGIEEIEEIMNLIRHPFS